MVHVLRRLRKTFLKVFDIEISGRNNDKVIISVADLPGELKALNIAVGSVLDVDGIRGIRSECNGEGARELSTSLMCITTCTLNVDINVVITSSKNDVFSISGFLNTKDLFCDSIKSNVIKNSIKSDLQQQ